MTRTGTAPAPRRLPALALATLIPAILAGLVVPAMAAGNPPAARQAELIYRLRQDCGSCHGYTLKGGLGPSLLPAALKDKDNDVLVHVILHGMPGRPMPPWNFEVSRDEAHWLVRQMKRGLGNER